MTAGLERALGSLSPPVTTADGAYARTGFHHAHTVEAGAMARVAEAFARHGYFLEMIACIDLRPSLGRMRLTYCFNRYEPADRHRVQVDLAPTIPWTGPEPAQAKKPAPAAADLAAGDMHGVRFEGHPDLKRILLPDDVDFHALLKDFGRMEDAGKEASDG
jgi:Ni,Fe-hydrogenase III component G